VSLKVEGFDFESDLGDLAAHNRSNLDHNPDSNTPNKDYFVDHTNRNNIEAVSLALESLEGLHNDGEMEKYDH
jgi:hypothetical protein